MCVLMDKILRTDGQRGTWLICVLHVVPMQYSMTASNRCPTTSCRNDRLQLSISAPQMLPAPFLSGAWHTGHIWCLDDVGRCIQEKRSVAPLLELLGPVHCAKLTWEPTAQTRKFHIDMIMKGSSVSQSTGSLSDAKQHTLTSQPNLRFCSESHEINVSVSINYLSPKLEGQSVEKYGRQTWALDYFSDSSFSLGDPTFKTTVSQFKRYRKVQYRKSRCCNYSILLSLRHLQKATAWTAIQHSWYTQERGWISR